MSTRKLLVSVLVTVLVAGASLFATGVPEGDVLRVGHIYDPASSPVAADNYEWFAGIARELEAEHDGLTVELQFFQWDEIDSRVMADFRAGLTEHDVIMTSPQLMAQHAAVGTLEDLQSRVDADWSEEQLADFTWAAPWADAEVGGQLLGIPLGAHARVLAYNTEMFEEVGLDPSRPPQTLEEVGEYARMLTRDTTGDGSIDVYGLGIYLGPSRATIELAFAPLLWEFGGELWDEETMEATFADEAGVRTVQVLRDLIDEYQVVSRANLAGTYDDNVMRAFVNGDVAMAWGWGSYWISMLESEGFIEGVFPPTENVEVLRGTVGPNPTSLRANFTNAWNVSISSVSQNKDLAWEFVQKMIEADRLIEFPDAGLPIRQSLWDAPEYQTEFYGIWQEAVEMGRGMPPTAHYGELADTVAAALQEILVQDADIESTLQRFQDEYNRDYAGQ